MKRSCPYCGGIHEIGYVCDKKPRKDYSKYIRDKQIDKFRWTKAWQTVRDKVRVRDQQCCVLCQHNLYPYGSRQYTYDNCSVHHVISLEEDYSKRNDMDNLILLCSVHHSMAEKKEIPLNEILELIKEQNEKHKEKLKNN